MTDWRVLLLSALAFLALLAGLLVLAMPDSYEGEILYDLSDTHSVRSLDVKGVVLMAAGGVTAWAAGLLWQRRIKRS
ncbi:MAG: hypothetical protein JW900_15560 [Anaerolineae bacterium]|nr:hypothetical protein [Anaerolineae bacterium]